MFKKLLSIFRRKTKKHKQWRSHWDTVAEQANALREHIHKPLEGTRYFTQEEIDVFIASSKALEADEDSTR